MERGNALCRAPTPGLVCVFPGFGADCLDVASPESGSRVPSPVVVSFKTLWVSPRSDHSASGCSGRASIPKRNQMGWFLVTGPAEWQSCKGLGS